jgi:hypothetical protein
MVTEKADEDHAPEEQQVAPAVVAAPLGGTGAQAYSDTAMLPRMPPDVAGTVWLHVRRSQR